MADTNTNTNTNTNVLTSNHCRGSGWQPSCSLPSTAPPISGKTIYFEKFCKFQDFFFKITRNYTLALILIATIFLFHIVNFNFKLNVQINLVVFWMSIFLWSQNYFPELTFWPRPRLFDLRAKSCVLLTFGGSGRIVNFHLSDSLRRGSLLPKESIHPCNRTVFGHVRAVKSENCILGDAPSPTMSVFEAVFTFWDFWVFLSFVCLQPGCI